MCPLDPALCCSNVLSSICLRDPGNLLSFTSRCHEASKVSRNLTGLTSYAYLKPQPGLQLPQCSWGRKPLSTVIPWPTAFRTYLALPSLKETEHQSGLPPDPSCGLPLLPRLTLLLTPLGFHSVTKNQHISSCFGCGLWRTQTNIVCIVG